MRIYAHRVVRLRLTRLAKGLPGRTKSKIDVKDAIKPLMDEEKLLKLLEALKKK